MQTALIEMPNLIVIAEEKKERASLDNKHHLEAWGLLANEWCFCVNHIKLGASIIKLILTNFYLPL